MNWKNSRRKIRAKIFSSAPRRKEPSNASRQRKTKKGPSRIHDFGRGGVVQAASANAAPVRARGPAETFAVAGQYAALYGFGPGTPRSHPDAHARNGRQPGRN